MPRHEGNTRKLTKGQRRRMRRLGTQKWVTADDPVTRDKLPHNVQSRSSRLRK